MREIFLGKPWHWALLVVIGVAFWLAGEYKLHVIYFNRFLSVLLLGTLALVLVLVVTTRPGERVTRDEIEIDDD